MSIIIETIRQKQGSCPRPLCHGTDRDGGELSEFVLWLVTLIARLNDLLIAGSSECGLKHASREQLDETEIPSDGGDSLVLGRLVNAMPGTQGPDENRYEHYSRE